MTHKFDAKNKHKLDNEQRRKLLPPKQTLINLGLQKGDMMADIGCGIGYFTIPASKIVGDSGKIIAMDISPEMLQDVQMKINENNISNIEIILTEENNLKLEDNKATFAFISLVLHEANDKENFLSEVKRIIAPGGKIAIVEWEKITGEFGPPIDHRLDRIYLTKMLDSLGFSDISTIDIGEDFYGIIAHK
ncbi:MULTISPECIES: class I SAM-dependent methyltransferase [unclassified Clostridium]|uniref:class I SAM-dependent methyltransferase n=1 Tax=unclassified Clostridium TaxID=2614128 RepID=UPI0002983298|nr:MULTISPECIES: class I SAM-dependent methyltransferase [unclassified Clostridium]EKQ56171.1 MAG: methylase involved in ubiquinone/menaquinone biosynthesis [Clostridium sp. Maddingley MBC34-26]